MRKDQICQKYPQQITWDLRSCNFSFKIRFSVESCENTPKHQKAFDSRCQLLIPQTLQTFFRGSNIDFVEKVTKAFLSRDILLYKLNNKHIKILFHDIGHSLPSATT